MKTLILVVLAALAAATPLGAQTAPKGAKTAEEIQLEPDPLRQPAAASEPVVRVEPDLLRQPEQSAQPQAGLKGEKGEKGDPGKDRIVYAGGQAVRLTQRGSRTVAARPVGHRRVYQEVKRWNPASVSFVIARDEKNLADAKDYADRAATAAKEGTSPMWLATVALVVGLVALALHLVGRVGRPVRPYQP